MQIHETSEWQVECENVGLHLSNLLFLAGRRQTAAAVIELIRSVPRKLEDAGKAPSESLFARCSVDALKKRPKYCDEMFETVCTYLEHLMTLPPSKRDMLEASFVGVILGYGMGG